MRIARIRFATRLENYGLGQFNGAKKKKKHVYI